MASDDLVGQYGEGATCQEAVHDLFSSLYESRELLAERRDQLAEGLAQDLAMLEACL